MGVLDDAIREHLELKRKHGAPEQEVEQQAQEALGPPRGQPTPPAAESEPDAPEAPVAEESVVEQPPAEPVAEDPATEIFSETDFPEPVESVDEVGEAREPEEEPEPSPEPPRGDTPPRGFEPVEEPPPAGDTGEEDVLEETPDFLQETPEHDRLWFEQKPPRDFDFDE